jgi:hypothetical protein
VLSLVLVLALAACGNGAAEASAPGVECALAGAADFAPDCTMEQVEEAGQRILILRHPDGGFRRFELGVPDRGIITADGVEQAEVIRAQGQVELRVGADRYRLPVTE